MKLKNQCGFQTTIDRKLCIIWIYSEDYVLWEAETNDASTDNIRIIINALLDGKRYFYSNDKEEQLKFKNFYKTSSEIFNYKRTKNDKIKICYAHLQYI